MFSIGVYSVGGRFSNWPGEGEAGFKILVGGWKHVTGFHVCEEGRFLNSFESQLFNLLI